MLSTTDQPARSRHRALAQASRRPTQKHPQSRLRRPAGAARPQRRTGQRAAGTHPRRARDGWCVCEQARSQGQGARMNYARPWMSFPDQLELLKSRGMEVSDERAALSYLERIGYYRLSAYWYPFRVWTMQQDAQSGRITHQRTDQFMAGARFVDAANLYLFDKKLRLTVLDALER